MQKLINLARARKQRARDEKRADSEKNTASAGVTKADRLLQATKNTRAQKMLDQHVVDTEFDHE
ncbi:MULTISPECIES: DUF4169 family protein [Falsihalocynthiibacter]|uniref:Uncharacterized protein n=1 Tax=Falsihalocynthiibacter arcticus TaxID=1579316 RepID=A0A126V3W0_9RHOB|nr:DUF4169 family protein [Falsihalocynthiibacter arcticus]AML52556.1 hypothetical protein RC74_15915 [Falsihalocynthiibacter arcticus]